eukprot:185963-Rhodomonas_salina.1
MIPATRGERLSAPAARGIGGSRSRHLTAASTDGVSASDRSSWQHTRATSGPDIDRAPSDRPRHDGGAETAKGLAYLEHVLHAPRLFLDDICDALAVAFPGD